MARPAATSHTGEGVLAQPLYWIWVLVALTICYIVNVMDRSQTLSLASGRRTTRSLDPSAKLWVYGRAGQPCRRCGSPIRSKKTGPDARVTYWCPRCQPGPLPHCR